MNGGSGEERRVIDRAPMTIWQFVLRVSKPFRWQLAVMFVIMFVWALDEAALRPYLVKLILDRMQRCPGQDYWGLIVVAVGYVIASFIVTWSFRLYDWVSLRSMPQLRARIVDVLSDYMMGHSHAYYQNHFAGALSTRLTAVSDAVPRLLEIFFERFLSSALRVVIALAALWAVMPALSCAAAIWATLFIAGVAYLSTEIRVLADAASGMRAEVTGAVVDVMGNNAAVRLFSGRQYEQDRLRGILSRATSSEVARDWALLKLSLYQGTLFAVLEGITLFLLVSGFQSGVITAGDAALVFSVNLSLIMALWGLSQDGAKFMRFLGEIAQGLRAIVIPYDMPDVPHAPALRVTGGSIVFEHVSFSYHSRNIFFRDLSVQIPAGQRVGLVGFSGSGKSTFVNLILRLFDVDKGKILIDGQDITAVSQSSLREAIALIPQDSVLFHRTLFENIQYGRLGASEQEVVTASTRAHAHEFIMSLPDQYEAMVGERGVLLSGGQRQRIAIARAFLKQSPILIMDEATSALDSVTERYVQEGLEELMVNRTTLVIAHRLSTLLKMDRILVFDQGALVEDGTHEELLHRKGLYYRLWSAQIGGFLPE